MSRLLVDTEQYLHFICGVVQDSISLSYFRFSNESHLQSRSDLSSNDFCVSSFDGHLALAIRSLNKF
jgi:hypothetical protein